MNSVKQIDKVDINRGKRHCGLNETRLPIYTNA